MVLFLEDFLKRHLESLAAPDPFLESIYVASKSANTFLRNLYRSGLFLDPNTAYTVAQAGIGFLRSYSEAAQQAYNMNLMRFKLNPKFHAMIHIVDRFCQSVESGHRWTWNALAESSQQDEDFVGKISKLSCAVSARSVHLQGVSRYLTNAWRYLKGK